MKKVFLDYASATPLDKDAYAAMAEFLQNNFYNPSALYENAYQVKKTLDETRANFAKAIGAKPDEIIFTAGATEANNIALKGLKNKYKGEILCSEIEHKAVIKIADQTIKVSKQGLLDLKDLKAKIHDDTVLVSVMLVNNETGVVQDLPKIRGIIDKEIQKRQNNGNKTPLNLHSDASQAGNLLDLHISRLKVDMLTINSAKVYGPKQVAGLYLDSAIELEPIIKGGGQERGLRSGSENTAGIIGFTKAFIKAQKMHREEFKRLEAIAKFAKQYLSDNIDQAEIVNNKHCLPSFLTLIMPGADGERLVMALDFAGYECGTGAACSALENDSSHVLKAIGYSEEQARSSIRISLGRDSKQKDLKNFIDTLAEVYKKELAIS